MITRLSYREIGKKLNLNLNSVRFVIKKKKDAGSTANQSQYNRLRKLNERQKSDIIKQSSKNPSLSASELAADVASRSGSIVTSQTIRNIPHTVNIRGRVPRKKNNISVKQISQKRIVLSKAYFNKPAKF